MNVDINFEIAHRKEKKALIVFFMLLTMLVSFFPTYTYAQLPSNDPSNSGSYGQGQTQFHDKKEFNCGYPDNPNLFVCDMSSTCWYCKPFATVVEVIQNVALKVYENVIGGLMGLLAACYCIWIAVKIISYIAQSKETDIGEFYTDIGAATLRVCIAGLILGMGSGIWTYTVSPLSSAVFEYGSAAINSGGGSSGCRGVPLITFSTSIKTDTIAGSMAKMLIGEGSSAGGLLAAINQKLMSIVAYGWLMASAAMTKGDGCLPFQYTSVFFAGIPLMIFAIALLIAIPLKCADIIFRLGIFLILLPLFVVAWAFPLTKQFFEEGVNLLLHIMVNLLMFAIILGLCTSLIMNSMEISSVDFSKIDLALATLKANYSLDSAIFIKTTVLLFFSYVVLEQAKDVTDRITDANYDSSSFEKNMKNAPKNIAKGAGKVALAAANVATAGKAGTLAKAFEKGFKKGM